MDILFARLYLWWTDKAKPALRKAWQAFLLLWPTRYQVVQYHNQLTNEIYFYIEYKDWTTQWRWKEYKIKSHVFQQQFGCDRDGMFGKLENAVRIMKFLKGDLKIVRKIPTIDL